MVQTADSTTLLSTYQPKDEAEKGVAYLEPFIDVGDNSDLRRLYGDVGAIRFQFWPDSVTDGKARASHVLELAERMSDAVQGWSDIRLVPEVVYLE